MWDSIAENFQWLGHKANNKSQQYTSHLYSQDLIREADQNHGSALGKEYYKVDFDSYSTNFLLKSDQSFTWEGDRVQNVYSWFDSNWAEAETARALTSDIGQFEESQVHFVN